MFLGINIRSKINSFNTFQFFQFFRFGILLLVDIILAKWGFEPENRLENIGVYKLFILVSGSITFFWVNGFLQSLLSIHGNSKTFNNETKNPLIFNVSIIMLLMGILAAGIIYLFSNQILTFFADDEVSFDYIHLLIMYVIISSPVTIVEYFYLIKNKNKSLVIYSVLTYSAQLLCVSVPALFNWGINYVFIGLILINAVRFIWLIFIVLSYSQIKISTEFLKEYIILTIPIIASFLLSGSDQYIDGYIITANLGKDALAVYRYGAREIPFLIIPISSFCAVYLVKISQSKDLKLTLNVIKENGSKMMKIIFPISIFFVLTSKFLFPLVFSKDFSESAIIFNIYSLLIVMRFAFFRTVLLGIRDTRPLVVSSFIEIIINITLSLIFVQIWGLIGVAIATVISYYCDVVFLCLYLKYFKNIKVSEVLDLRLLAVFSVLLYVAFFLSILF